MSRKHSGGSTNPNFPSGSGRASAFPSQRSHMSRSPDPTRYPPDFNSLYIHPRRSPRPEYAPPPWSSSRINDHVAFPRVSSINGSTSTRIVSHHSVLDGEYLPLGSVRQSTLEDDYIPIASFGVPSQALSQEHNALPPVRPLQIRRKAPLAASGLERQSRSREMKDLGIGPAPASRRSRPLQPPRAISLNRREALLRQFPELPPAPLGPLPPIPRSHSMSRVPKEVIRPDSVRVHSPIDTGYIHNPTAVVLSEDYHRYQNGGHVPARRRRSSSLVRIRKLSDTVLQFFKKK